MRRGVALYGVTEESAGLIPLLESRPDLEVVAVYDPAPAEARAKLEALGGDYAARLGDRFVADPRDFLRVVGLSAIIDAGRDAPLAERIPEVESSDVEVVSTLTARLLWGYGPASRERQGELLQALREIVDSLNLASDGEELFSRILDIAISVLGADGGSLMLLDAAGETLSIRVAKGVEPELWSKVRTPLGQGIAGRVASEVRAARVRGKADPEEFHILRERFDVKDALSLPLVHSGRIQGVLNLHSTANLDTFSDDDVSFAEELARASGEILARAEEHQHLRRQAHRYALVTEVRQHLGVPQPLEERLSSLCALLAKRVGRGTATVYLLEPESEELRLTATSMATGSLLAELRVPVGTGIDGQAAGGTPELLHGPDGALRLAAMPLPSAGETVGVLSVQVGTAPRRANDLPVGRAAEETLREIAAALADEIAKAWREERMETRATKATAINEAGLRLISAREISEVVRQSTASGALVLEADHALLRLLDPESNRYVIRSYYGSADRDQREQLFALDKDVSVTVIRQRESLLVHRSDRDERWNTHEASVRSILGAPLLRDGRVVGTLTFYDKMAADAFFPGHFSRDDLEVLNRYARYVERAVTNALFYRQAKAQSNFDEATGLPNAEYLARRIDQEIARAGGRPNAFALATCRIENLSELRSAVDAAHAERVVQRTAEAMRDKLRDFDIVARTADDEFAALLPEPGDLPGDRVADLARAVAEDIVRNEALNDPIRIGLVFGYTVPESSDDPRESLVARAREPRIRML